MSTDTATPETAQTHPFQAEVAELLRLMVHSVYSETDIFLRELISNASDACDRLRYEAIAKPELLGDDSRLAIRITPDAAAGTLTISDNGIGMDRQELIDNLGTVARSGTRAFISRIAEAAKTREGTKDGTKDGARDGGGLIGQFGVGFYSAFMVADRIEVTSRHAGSSDAWAWRSEGGAGFEIAPASEEQAARVARGTEIVLHLKADAKDYLEPHAIERIVRTYSDHIMFPIELAGQGADGAQGGEAGSEAGSESASKSAPRQINKASAIWQRPKSELTGEDYTQAYHALGVAFDDPAMTIHYRAEGRQSYAVLLFAPTRAPYDLFDPQRKGHVKLYVRRVYISDDAALLPSYLRFIRGVVDSEDLPLNISREMLQNNPQVAQMRKELTGRVLREMETLAKEEKPETYGKIWEAFGAVIKEGLYEDHERREQLLALARFTTTTGTLRSLKQYVADLKSNQTEIYYLAGDNLDRLKSNPKLEAARARGIEVLLLTDPIDSFWTMGQADFEGKPLKSLSQGEVNFDLVPLTEQPADEAKPASAAVDDAVVIAAVKAALGEQVSDVRASQRLTDSAACLVAGGKGPDRELERLLARQSRGSGTKPILELNMRHPMVRALADAKTGARDDDVADLAGLLFDQAQILDGEVPPDPAAFAARLNRLVVRGLPAAG